MELRQLKYFIEIADAGSICEGARKLNMSQPPLSYQMKLLEEELGVQLLERNRKGIALTEAGQLFYARATGILQMTWNTARELENLKVQKTLRLGLTSTSGPAVIDKIKHYTKAYPYVRFEIHDGMTYDLIEALKRDQIDIAILREPAPFEGLDTNLIVREPMIAVGTTDYLTAKQTISLHELAKKPLIFHRRYSPLILAAFKSHGLSVNIVCECDDARTSLLWADAGIGVAIFPQSMTLLKGQLQSSQIAENSLCTGILLAWLKNQKIPELLKEFIDFFQK